MIDHLFLRRSMYVSILVLVFLAASFVRLLPLSHGTTLFPPPELGLMLAFAWTLRRPDYVPVILVAFLFLIGDMLFMRPPGVWPALAVIALEFLRTRQASAHEQTFLAEWVLVTGVVFAMILMEWLVLTVFMVDHASFGKGLLRIVSTAAFYPVVVLVSTWGFGVARPRPGELDAEVI
ncbi:MAG: rod shape-determining protein MreD [Maritimibacter sp.]